MQISPLNSKDIHDLRNHVSTTLNHLDHVLPGQAPILDFVHHNTLHGFQGLPFEDALAAFERLTGIGGYLPEAQFRVFYQQGRISDRDLAAAFASAPQLQPEQCVCQLKDRTISRQEIFRIAMLFGLDGLTVSQLNWHIEELNALGATQADVPESVRLQLLADGGPEGDAIRSLWESILIKLDLRQAGLHPENLLDLSLEQAEDWLAGNGRNPGRQSAPLHLQMQQQAGAELDGLLAQVGEGMTLRGFILALTGTDILDAVRPQLIRYCASGLDEGLAPWQMPERSRLGLYAAWRETARFDANPFLHELPDWQEIMAELPADATDAIILQLSHLDIPQSLWAGYLQRLALELPGWSGLINWRQQHPRYQGQNNVDIKLADYLAIRLTLDRLWLNQICRETWLVEAKLGRLKRYFAKNLSEFMVRSRLYRGDLPEYLTQKAEALTLLAGSERHERSDWQQLADQLWTWQSSPVAEQQSRQFKIPDVYGDGWRLFRLCQHLGLNAAQVRSLEKQDLEQMLSVVDEFAPAARNPLWLAAYEQHYREDLFQALRANHNRGRWARRDQRPEAQIIFCMDDREEGFRRHLEEFNPAIETLGAAGFFGVSINYKGLDDTGVSALCPVVVTPAHEVHEVSRSGSERMLARHNQGRLWLRRAGQWLHQGLRRNLLSSVPLIDVIAPAALAGLVGKSLAPKLQQNLVGGMAGMVSPDVETELLFTSTDTDTLATPEQPKLGFTDHEQADRVAGFLRNTGLTYGFSELVVLMGHGSASQNNPHRAAYDCGACSGRHGGPNARVFAAMANRPEIRKLLAERGIDIPADSWFIGAEHNTCNEDISWYDLADMPKARQTALQKLQQALRHAQRLSAHERCRRLASAPRNPTPEQALAHIVERAADFSQARPELGHATNASAVVGRRSLTQGVFFDRRVFLISYDPTQDPEGTVLEGLLLAVGPVGAGINLEYYFSTVNNDRFGCGSKVPHNVTGLFGVMEGAASDLRTGLPRQMIEIHEAMRLQIVVEAKTSVLEQIYGRQDSLRELIGGGWVHLSAKDPDTGELFVFERGTGFVSWQAPLKTLPASPTSPDCYRSQTLPVAPVLISQPEFLGV